MKNEYKARRFLNIVRALYYLVNNPTPLRSAELFFIVALFCEQHLLHIV
jgi:hypothetical protein